jgi:hypothetical protein
MSKENNDTLKVENSLNEVMEEDEILLIVKEDVTQ